jgi:hypothetical protein
VVGRWAILGEGRRRLLDVHSSVLTVLEQLGNLHKLSEDESRRKEGKRRERERFLDFCWLEDRA